MAKYQIYNGTSWVDICDCTTKVLDSTLVWRELNPRACPVRYYDGSNWCLVQCELLCGDEVSADGADGVYYMPFNIPSGILGITITLSPAAIPDGFSIITNDKVTKLASLGLVGEPTGTPPIDNAWITGTSLPKTVFNYQNASFINSGLTEIITFYGEGVGDPPGDTPMSNLGGLTMYNSGPAGVPGGLPQPNMCSLSPEGVLNPNIGNRCYQLTYLKLNPAIAEDILIQVVGGNVANTGWNIFDIECLEK